METKKCRICGKIYPITLEFFHKNKNMKDGLLNTCKKCKNEINKKREDKNYMKVYYAKNKDKIRKQVRKYREENINKIREQTRKYNRKRREKDNKQVQFSVNIHKWIRRHKPKQDCCSICNEKKRLELSNLSGNYKKNINDYWWLCRDCHVLFDKINQTHKKSIEKELIKIEI